MIIIALGSNLDGAFGTPYQSIRRALNELSASGIEIKDASRLYRTRAYGSYPQPDFLNAIATAYTPLPAQALLEIFKRIEAQAGRHEAKKAHRWIPRPLDLDIVSYKGVVYNWKMRKPLEGKRVVLPHPRAHERAFVLQPLSDVAPFWHHPVFGLTAREFLKRPAVRQTGKILSAGELLR
jgi:2-amino-4-hydroxy-6-hydroxymethyldihydropteridine diphosphokinase